jgi:hypothetical protein
LSVKDKDILIGIDSPDTPAMGRDLGELADNRYENVRGWIKFEDILIGIDREYGIAVHSNLGKSPRDISKGETVKFENTVAVVYSPNVDRAVGCSNERDAC